jgi:hypothetical protein
LLVHSLALGELAHIVLEIYNPTQNILYWFILIRMLAAMKGPKNLQKTSRKLLVNFGGSLKVGKKP